jgi:hypothetical protein
MTNYEQYTQALATADKARATYDAACEARERLGTGCDNECLEACIAYSRAANALTRAMDTLPTALHLTI